MDPWRNRRVIPGRLRKVGGDDDAAFALYVKPEIEVCYRVAAHLG